MWADRDPLLLLFIFSVSAQNIVPLGTSATGTINPGQPPVIYAVTVPIGTGNFQITLWRTNVASYQTASISASLRGPTGSMLNFTSMYSGNGQLSGAYNLTLSPRGSSPYQFLLQTCLGSCPGSTQCYYSSKSGYCNNNGACLCIFPGCSFPSCTCDNVTSSSSISLDIFSCFATDTSGITSLFLSLLGVWIAVIVVGFILVFIVPIVVCCCCCGLCAAAATHETAPIVHHHHNYSHH